MVKLVSEWQTDGIRMKLQVTRTVTKAIPLASLYLMYVLHVRLFLPNTFFASATVFCVRHITDYVNSLVSLCYFCKCYNIMWSFIIVFKAIIQKTIVLAKNNVALALLPNIVVIHFQLSKLIIKTQMNGMVLPMKRFNS